MENSQVNIDFDVVAISLQEYARTKALKAGSTIVYVQNGQVIEEDPGKGTKTILKTVAGKLPDA